MGGELIFTGESSILQVFAAAYAPIDSSTVYIGASTNQPHTNPLVYRFTFLRAGSIRRVLIGLITGPGASAEAGSMYLSVTDANTGVVTDYLISNTVMFNASGEYTYPSKTDEEASIGVAPWDSCNIKIVHPAFATNPTAVSYYGAISVGS